MKCRQLLEILKRSNMFLFLSQKWATWWFSEPSWLPEQRHIFPLSTLLLDEVEHSSSESLKEGTTFWNEALRKSLEFILPPRMRTFLKFWRWRKVNIQFIEIKTLVGTMECPTRNTWLTWFSISTLSQLFLTLAIGERKCTTLSRTEVATSNFAQWATFLKLSCSSGF